MKHNFTLVTGLWDLGRGNLKDFGRSFGHYLDCFEKLLTLDYNLLIYIPHELDSFVRLRRSTTNTKTIIKDLDQFDKWLDFFDDIQTIREKASWVNQADWLRNSPQAKLKYYNPVVMSKYFLLNDATVSNPFNTDYFFWIDGGLTNTVNLDNLKNLRNIPDYMKEINDKLLFLSYPYESDNEVHGFEAKKFAEYCGVERTKYVCRGGFFGGKKEIINELNGYYYSAAKNTLTEGYMGTEENFHTIMSHTASDRVHRFELQDDGLVFRFFEYLQKYKSEPISNADLIEYDKKKEIFDIKTSLYVLSFNSPKQFETLIQTYQKNDPNFIKYTRKILVDNSTDRTTYKEYNKICKRYDFEHIKKEDNIGICGGRQFIAEHFNESDSEYYIFLEDDMNLNDDVGELCNSGYRKYVEDLYYKSLSIIHKERYDYLKLSFTEFFGDNRTQWAWYNIPQNVREQYFPDNAGPPEGITEDAPKIEPKIEKRFKDLKYYEGNYYYCNWPLWFSRKGNRKVFLDTKWSKPYEQTWMSHVFQLQQNGDVKSAVLQLSPINHHRFDHYDGKERVES